MPLLVITILLLFSFNGCRKEDDSLMFEPESVTNPDNVEFDYYLYDESEDSKYYWFCANSLESEITLTCNNSSGVEFETLQGKTSNEYVCRSGYWSAKFTTPYTVVFTFDRVDQDSVKFTTIIENFNFISKYEEPNRRISVQVTRLMRSTDPFIDQHPQK